MQQPMKGVRVLEVAQFTFVPAAGAVLADWGADVIKIEHPETGDAQRGLSRLLGMKVGNDDFAPLMEHANRGKRSIGLALDTAEGRPVLEALIRGSDVFLTNFLPAARARLGIDIADVRAINPDIIYVRGSGFGARGDEADKGGYDSTAFWARAGSAHGVTPPDLDGVCQMPAGAYGDSIGGMTIAGGIAAALFARAQTGEASVVDVSLLGVGAWATGLSVNFALAAGGPLPRRRDNGRGAPTNPLIGAYRTADDRWLMLSMLQPGRYWSEFCERIGRTDLLTDDRFDTTEKVMKNAAAAAAIVQDVLESAPLASWIERFAGMEGQWSVVQDAWEVGRDPSLRANGFISKVAGYDADHELVANPVQFDETPVALQRGPRFAEHTDDIVRELGMSDEELIELKIAGAIT